MLLTEDLQSAHNNQVLHVSFSHNGRMFATCSKDGFVHVSYNARSFAQASTDQIEWPVSHPFRATDMGLSAPGVPKILARHAQVQLEVHAILAVQPKWYAAAGVGRALRVVAHNVRRDRRVQRYGRFAFAVSRRQSAVRHIRRMVQWSAFALGRFVLAGQSGKHVRAVAEQGQPGGGLGACAHHESTVQVLQSECELDPRHNDCELPLAGERRRRAGQWRAGGGNGWRDAVD